MRKHQMSGASKALLSILAVLLIVAFAFSFEGTAAQASKPTAAKNIVVVHGAFAEGGGKESTGF